MADTTWSSEWIRAIRPTLSEGLGPFALQVQAIFRIASSKDLPALPSQVQAIFRIASSKDLPAIPSQVQAIFRIASSKDLPAIPESLSPAAAEFVLLCLQVCVGGRNKMGDEGHLGGGSGSEWGGGALKRIWS